MQLPITAIYEAAGFIRRRTTVTPTIGLILGSGLSSLADHITAGTAIPYAHIPHFVRSTVQGHVGELAIGSWEGKGVAMMHGRVHAYEGYTIQQITFPIRVMWALGVRTLIVTNAAGGLNPNFTPGDLMLITDHIGLPNMTGLNPLFGPNLDQIGPRFPDMSQAYDPALRQITMQAATDLGIELQQGVYVMASGPSYETPAETRFLRQIGADAVGMSTVPEVTVARHAGIRVLGISGISNVAFKASGQEHETTHEEVLETGRAIAAKLGPLIQEILRRLPV